jgi:hypothetical protein
MCKRSRQSVSISPSLFFKSAAGAGYRCEIGERINIEVDCAQPILRAGRSVPARLMVLETAVTHVHAIDDRFFFSASSRCAFWTSCCFIL